MKYSELVTYIFGCIIVKYISGEYFLWIPLYNDSINNSLFVKLNQFDKEGINEFMSELNHTDDVKSLLEEGSENFLPVESYYISQSLADRYNITNEDIIYADYFIEDEDEYYLNNEYWEGMFNTNNDIDNLEYYMFKNKLLSFEFSEDELLSLNSTFMKLIQKNTSFTEYNIGKNAIYKAVIDFYANGQYDEATVLMNTIFNGTLTTTATTSSCGCGTQSTCASSISSSSTGINTGTEIVPVDTATCIDMYKAAMYQWLIQMLSDTDFYCCWMFNVDEETDESEPNEVLLDNLIKLLEEFLALGLDLSNLGNTSKSVCGCGHSKKYNVNSANKDCSDLLNNSGIGGCSNYNIILNYIKALKWVKNNEIEENKNKIYIYGKQFAEIFPLLNF